MNLGLAFLGIDIFGPWVKLAQEGKSDFYEGNPHFLLICESCACVFCVRVGEFQRRRRRREQELKNQSSGENYRFILGIISFLVYF